MSKPLVPRGWKETRAVCAAKKPPFAISPRGKLYGKQYPAFNGSQNNKRNKKRPITLPDIKGAT